MRGLSLIQVSGQADRNSFKLENGYVTMDGSPYKYVLKPMDRHQVLGKPRARKAT